MQVDDYAPSSDWIDGFPPDSNFLKDSQRPQWRADIAALRALRLDEALSPLKMGDLFNEMKQRWGLKMPALAQEAGLPYHAARQRARVAEAIPQGSKLRESGLPYSILRLLAPLPDPQPWAQQALALQQAKQLRVRQFARLLEDAGVRRRRSPRPADPACLQCSGAITGPSAGFTLRLGDTRAWFCTPQCGEAYFSALQRRAARGIPPTRTRRESQSPPNTARTTHESQSASPSPAETRRESQSPPTATDDPDPDTHIIRIGGRFVGMWKRRDPPP